MIGDFGLSPLLAFPLVLVMGCAFGAFMGLLIDALKIPAFIITLAGMFFCAVSAISFRKSRFR